MGEAAQPGLASEVSPAWPVGRGVECGPVTLAFPGLGENANLPGCVSQPAP